MEIRFLSFDIDDTLLPSHHQSDGFYKLWNRLEFKDRPLLCYNTGRMREDTLRLVQHKLLPRPDFLICGVGTIIYDVNEGRVVKEFAQILEEGWDLDKVSRVMHHAPFHIEKQPDHYQNPYKSSWFFNNAADSDIDELRQLLRREGLDVNVIYSSSRHLDILPKWANKGNSLEWLLNFLGIDPSDALVAGNSGNDSAMYSLQGINGIIVGNAQPELLEETKGAHVFVTGRIYEEAILDGLRHFALKFSLSEVQQQEEELTLSRLNLMDTSEVTAISPKQVRTIREGYEMALEVIRRNITPIGFSSCSLEDNDAARPDTDYRSVWARDGSITICGTIGLTEDETIYTCQRLTLETLLANTSENGQIPTNVSIDTLLPDYSGEGGICSIDSGLWLIIACHDFIKGSGDLDFLRKHIDTLTRITVWLAAHDGNNDSLLEIPEAGDWMNRKGRGYNVLYDEVLWYRVNVCMGRLYELLGEDNLTGRHITWSQVIKNSILRNFWPSSDTATSPSNRFASMQFAPEDARYLIAQSTPYDFSWRCDIYGNVLAHLFGVTDKARATRTFRFIWGTGGSEPYPVKNIYPAILTDDPDHRSYYNSNLLNLPHHYHNGGIWPFVGGAWVRFIHKLGMRELALQELHKLAKLNRLGIISKWEFNEWHHGITGRPMGRAYQAWSAAEYIAACHDLGIVD